MRMRSLWIGLSHGSGLQKQALVPRAGSRRAARRRSVLYAFPWSRGTQPARIAQPQTNPKAAKRPFSLYCVARLALLRTLINLDIPEVRPVPNVGVMGSNPIARSNNRWDCRQHACDASGASL